MNTAVNSLLLEPNTPRVRTWLARTGAAVWRGLAASGQARASRELLAYADRCEANQPELAKELRMAVSQGAGL